MATTGEVFPTSGTSVSEAPWSDNTWGTDAANITADDGTYAAVTETTFDNGDQTWVLKAQGFDFSGIPDGSTINGVTVRVQSRADSTSVGIDLVQLLSTAGAKVGTNKSDTSQRLTTSDAIYSFGGSADLWGNALTAEWVKDADFGVAVGGHAYTANSEIYVDYVTVEIDYTEPAPPSGEYTILTTQTPDTEDPASGQERMLGLRFTSTTDGTVVRGRWYVGATATSAAVTALWQLWRTSDTTKLVEVDVQALGDSTTNGWIEFDVPDTAITASTQYVVTRFTDDAYPFNYLASGTYPVTNGPLSADTSVFVNNQTSSNYPTGVEGTAMFLVDVVVSYGGAVDLDATGSAAAAATAAADVARTITATGSAAGSASAAMATGRALAATGSATAAADADLTVDAAPIQLDGNSNAAASAGGNLTATRPLAAVASAAADAAGTLTPIRGFGGAGSAAGTASAALSRQVAITATGSTAAVAEADLGIQGQVAFAAAGSGAASASGIITIIRGLGANGSVSGTADGQLVAGRALVGDANTAAAATADLSIGQLVLLDAVLAAAAQMVGDLSVVGPITVGSAHSATRPVPSASAPGTNWLDTAEGRTHATAHASATARTVPTMTGR